MENLPILTGEKVVLRPITDADTDNIVRWRNTPSVRDNFIFRQTFTPEMHRNWLKTKVATGEVVQYIIVDKAADTAVGSVYYRDVDHTFNSAEYGIFIGEESARGKGFGTETARLFTDFGFTALHLHRISLRVLAENTPARRSYAAAGFEGVIRECEADIHLFRQGRRSHDNSLKRPELPHGVDSLFCTFGDNDGSAGLVLRLGGIAGVRPADEVIAVTRRKLSDGYFIFNVKYLSVLVRAIVEVKVQSVCHI